MRQRIERMRHISAVVLADILDHFDPRREIALQNEIDLREIKITNLFHFATLEHFKRQQISPFLSVRADYTDAKTRIDKTKAAETGLFLLH